MMDAIINNIKSIIASAGLKYKAVAAMAGIDEGRFYRIMQGITELSCAELSVICRALKVTPNDVYGIATGIDGR